MPALKRNKASLILLGISSLVVPNAGFVPRQMGTHLNGLQLQESTPEINPDAWVEPDASLGIVPEEEEREVDWGLGGVRLAQESAIKITGEITHKPGKADAQPMELLRYTALNKVEESTVKSVMDKTGSKIICSGQGVEEYKDPGDSLEKVVILAPMEAIKDAFTNAGPAIDCETLVFNFLGGDDLMMGEVLDAAKEMVVMMDIATKAKITFNSLCHMSIPCGTCAVTVVSLGKNDYEGSNDLEKSIVSGEVYLRDGTYMTVQESDINTALA
ncbi:unnamed protein product [Cylindrotheca closterium]|uniref:Copper chaperone for superoxide dismutase n=1 Tax=Cylindrotheca closterium TaxID=2856 RepID=A0AAD2GAI2_9STRA|nr:unnamed protein product [Cylindrotheca closterium]